MTGYERIYRIVERVPRGRVATYGQIARLAGLAGHARRVGYALAALDDGRTVPWHRVVNARGEISARSDPHYEDVQRVRLEREGVAFDARGQIPLARFLWRPGAERARRQSSAATSRSTRVPRKKAGFVDR
jgi:methylated-DNA-protein-cysteine methyltransferase-like protein